MVLAGHWLFSWQENEHFITNQFLKELGVKVNHRTVADALEEHPDFPSLLAIKDVLSSFGVDSVAIKLDSNHFSEIDIPFISQTKPGIFGSQLFTLVRPRPQRGFEYIDPRSGKWLPLEVKDVWSILEPIALLAEAGENAGEHNYSEIHKKEMRSRLFQWLRLILLPLSGLLLLGWFFAYDTASGPAFGLYFFLYLLGAGIGTLLLLYEIDQHSPLVKQVCSGGSGKINCNAVLGSKGASILGLSWSLVGFTYFFGGLIVLAVADIVNTAYLPLLSGMSLMVLPYIAYSLFYQWRVVRQWCRLCLTVQAVFAIQAFLVLYKGWHRSLAGLETFPVREMLSIVMIYALILVVGDALISSGKKAKEGKKNKQSLIRLKSNPEIFSSLLLNQRKAPIPPDKLGLILGDPAAKNTLIKVCNPYCGPCAKAHPDITALLTRNKDLKVQIIFTASNDKNDRKGPPVRHLLAIAHQGDEKQVKEALDEWYLAKEKNYDVFAARYPLNGELAEQGNHVERMREWCSTAQIKHTPTYFLNGYELPQIYRISDLDYFLKS